MSSGWPTHLAVANDGGADILLSLFLIVVIQFSVTAERQAMHFTMIALASICRVNKTLQQCYIQYYSKCAVYGNFALTCTCMYAGTYYNSQFNTSLGKKMLPTIGII